MNPTKIKIRLAETEDAELLSELGRETFHDAFIGYSQMPKNELKRYLNEAFTLESLSAQLIDENSIFLLAEIENEVVGYAKLETNISTKGVKAENPIKLKRLYCKQSFFGFGIGAVLMKRCLEEAAKRHHDTIWLTVWEHNLHAQSFYDRWNFEPCGSFDFVFGQTVLSDVVMQRHLDQ